MEDARLPTFDWRALDGHRFQSLALDLLRADGFEVLDQGVGPDGGVDAIAVQTVNLMPGLNRAITWAVQVKFHHDTNRSVGPAELGNVANILARFQADGFLLISNARVTAKAYSELRSVAKIGPPYFLTNVWPQDLVEARLLEHSNIRDRYLRPSTERCVLVVDDQGEWRSVITALVTALGYDVIAAPSASEARELLNRRHVDVAILDIRLDECNDADRSGLELGTYIQRHWPEARVIYLTGHQSAAIGRTAVSSGALSVLQKSRFSGEDLQHLISDPHYERVMSDAGREMIGHVVHRFGNRLGLARVMLQEQMRSSESDRVRRALSALDALANDLDDISSLASRYPASLSSAVTQVRMSTVIGDAIGLVADHDVVIEVYEDAALDSIVRCDRIALTEALKSLLVNAAEATEDCNAAKINIALTTHLRHRLFVKLSVFDNGYGVASEQLSIMYQPGSSTKPGGQGLGFFLAVKTVDELGGWVDVESPAGKWSTAIHVWLPAE